MIKGSKLYVPKKKILTTFLHFKPIKPSGCLSVKLFGYLNEGKQYILRPCWLKFITLTWLTFILKSRTVTSQGYYFVGANYKMESENKKG